MFITTIYKYIPPPQKKDSSQCTLKNLFDFNIIIFTFYKRSNVTKWLDPKNYGSIIKPSR